MLRQVSWLAGRWQSGPSQPQMASGMSGRLSAYSCGGSYGFGPDVGRHYRIPFSAELLLGKPGTKASVKLAINRCQGKTLCFQMRDR